MQHFEYSIDVNIPVRVAYEQWIRFEEFPSFMPTVKHGSSATTRRST